MSQASVRNWCRKFKADPTLSCLDQPRSGCPRFMRSQRHIQQVDRVIHRDNCRSVREISSITGISVGSIHRIIQKDLHLRKIAARFFPKLLSDEQRAKRLEVCQTNLERLRNEPTLLRNVVTGDESWVYCFQPNTKHKAQAWVSAAQERPVQALRSRSVKKVMLCAFFDDLSCVHFEFHHRTINRYRYTSILARLCEKLRRKRPGLWAPGCGWRRCVLLHHDNAPAHKAYHTRAHLKETGISLLEQPPYSPDLAPCDYFLFPRIKRELRGRHFANVDMLRAAVKEVIRKIPCHEFRDALLDLPRRWRRCVEEQGGYFEGMRKLHPANPVVNQGDDQ